MKKSFANRKSMMTVTVKFLETNGTVWAEIPKLVSSIGEFKVALDKIDEAEERQSDSKVLFGVEKNEIKVKAAVLGDEVNDVVEVFALMEGDSELAQRMKDSKSSLFKLSGAKFKLKIKSIIDAATTHKEVLCSEYGLEESRITALAQLLADFIEIENKPREFNVRSGVATQELEVLFKETSDILENKLDKLIKMFQSRNPEFYMGYARSRIVVD